MDKHIQISMLCEIYGKLLTEKQYSVLNDYYNNDLSLSELFEYEEKLGIMKKTQRQEKQIQTILSQISEIQNNSSDKKIEKILNEVQKELSVLV